MGLKLLIKSFRNKIHRNCRTDNYIFQRKYFLVKSCQKKYHNISDILTMPVLEASGCWNLLRPCGFPKKIVSKKRALISLKRIHKSSTALATDQFETAY